MIFTVGHSTRPQDELIAILSPILNPNAVAGPDGVVVYPGRR